MSERQERLRALLNTGSLDEARLTGGKHVPESTTYGTSGDDVLSGGNGKDTIYGGDGNDIISGGNGIDNLFGEGGDDQLTGDNGADHMTGGADDDTLDGSNGFDTAYYSGAIGEYSFFSAGGYLHVVHLGGAGADGHDRLIRVERLVFADRVVDVGSGNNVPVAGDDHVFITEDTGVYGSGAASVKDNDFDFDGDALTVTGGVFVGTYGTLTLNSNGTYTYALDASAQELALGDNVTDSFDYTVSDNDGSDTGTLVFHIAGLNDAPVANPDADTTSENAAVLVDVLANDSDIDNGAILTVVAASAPAGQGTASVVGNQVQFDPGSDFDDLAVGDSEVVVVSYSISDENGATASSTVTITVTGSNDGPVANPDADTTSENAAILVDVLANDTDADNGATLTVTAASAPAGQGTASVVGNQVQFDPGGDFDGLAVGESEVVVVGYTISDEHGATASSTLTITVTGTNDGPVANPDAATTGENAAVLIDVLANDGDVDNGAVLTVTGASAPAGQGTAAVVGNQIEFDPGSDFDYLAVGESAVVVVGYDIADEHGATASSTVTITVTGSNDAPTIDAGGTDADGAVSELPNGDPNENAFTHTDSGTIAFDDADLADTHSASFTPQAGGYLGTFTLDPVNQAGDSVGWDFSVEDSAIDFLDEGETLTQIYTVEIDDGNGGTVTQDVTITITGEGDSIPPDGTNWYIDNSAVGSAETGSPSDPFMSIAAFNAAQGTPGGPGVGDNVFLLAGTGAYAEADGINLLDGQTLTGVAAGPLRPTITATAGDGIDVAENNTISGVDIGTTSGAGIDDDGGTVGTLTVSDVGISGGGQIVDIDNGGTLDVTLNSAASTGSTGGAIDLAGLAGTFTVTGATSITGAHAGGAVDVTGGTLASAFSGGLTIATTSGFGLNAQNTGSVAVGGGSIATVGAGAVSLTNAASAGITVTSVSSTGGSASGVILVNAGAGGFTVTGTASVAGSGGTISGKTGADGVLTTGVGVYLSGTDNVSLANMTISTNANGGIVGANVDGFALIDSTLNLGNGSNSGEGSVAFTDLTGTATLLGNVIGGASGDNVRIDNGSGSLDLTVADSGSDAAIVGLNNNATGLDGLSITTSGSASLTLTIDGVDFQGARSDLVHVSAFGSSSQDIVITDSTFSNLQAGSLGGGVVLTGGGAGSNIAVDYRVEGNTFTGAFGSALTANYLHQAGAVRGYIEGNVIGLDDGITGAEGSVGGDGIVVGLEKADGAGDASHHVIIADNQVRDVDAGLAGISVRASGGDATDTATVEAIVQGNVVEDMGANALAAFYALVGGTGVDFAALGLEMDDNVFDADGALLNAVFLDQISFDAHYYFPGYAGSPDGEFLGGSASADLDAYLSGRGNLMINGLFPSFPGGVDAGLVFGVTGDPLDGAWYP